MMMVIMTIKLITLHYNSTMCLGWLACSFTINAWIKVIIVQSVERSILPHAQWKHVLCEEHVLAGLTRRIEG